MSNASINEEIRSVLENRLIQDLVGSVRSVIDKMERHVSQKEFLPEGLFQELSEANETIEAEILRRRAALSLIHAQIGGSDTETASSQSRCEWNDQENSSESSLEVEQGVVESETFDRKNSDEGSRPVVIEKQTTLDSLHDNIKALQAIVLLRMSKTMPSETSTTNDMVSFSILEDEMDILDGLSKHVMGSYNPSEDQSSGLLETKLMALPTLLNALFNEEIQEAVDRGDDIDDKTMMDMVVENQKRTRILRDIDSIANRVREVTQSIREKAKDA